MELARDVRILIECGAAARDVLRMVRGIRGLRRIRLPEVLQEADVQRDVLVHGTNKGCEAVNAAFATQRPAGAPKRFVMKHGVKSDKDGSRWHKHDVVPHDQLPNLAPSAYEEKYCGTVYVTQGSDYDHTVYIFEKGLFDVQTLYCAITRVHRLSQLCLVW